jgi:hypothetical protein
VRTFAGGWRALALGGATLALVLGACSAPNDSGGNTTTGGSGGKGNGGSSTTTTGGGQTTGSGGVDNPAGTGGTGDTGGGAVGGGGGAGGSSMTMGPACAMGAGMNTSGLAIKRPEIGARKLGSVAAATAVRIDHDPMSGAIVYMSREGKFWKVDPASGMSTPTETSYTGGGNDHRGMTFGPDGALYVLSHNAQNGVLIRKGSPGATRTWSTLVNSAGYMPGGTNFDHKFAGVIVSPDNMSLFFSSGSRSDHGEIEAGMGEVPLTSAIFKVPVSSNMLQLANDDTALKPYLYADGTRNSFDMAFNSEGELFAGDNGPDIDLPDEINWIREGKNYGFPWRFGSEDSPATDPQYNPAGDTRLHTGFQAVDQKKWVYDPKLPPKPTGLTDPIINHGPDLDHMRSSRTANVEDASMKGTPLSGITGHRSPLGLAFDVKGALCGDYYKAGFVLSYGALIDVLQDGGQDLALMNLTKVNGEYEMTMNVLVTGFTAPIDSVLVDNKLYVIENRYSGTPGAIYEITFPMPAK